MFHLRKMFEFDIMRISGSVTCYLRRLVSSPMFFD